jgi:hypothetical protein
MGDVTKKIGATNTPITMDYSTLQSWEDALPANLVTDGNRQIGECYDQGTFTATLTIGGETTDSTNYIFLRCASGASFSTKSGVRTTALLWNESGGVTIKTSATCITISTNNTRVDGLQTKRTSYTVDISVSGVTNCIITNCITVTGLFINSATTKVINCLYQGAGIGNFADNVGQFINCTVIVDGSGSSTALRSAYSGLKLTNCAVFGTWSTTVSGTLDAASDYNAMDHAAPTNWGSHSLASKTFSSQFVSTTTDFRAVDTGDLKAGTPSSDAPTDISGFTRDATTPYIGAWEVAASGGSSVSPSTRMTWTPPWRA